LVPFQPPEGVHDGLNPPADGTDDGPGGPANQECELLGPPPAGLELSGHHANEEAENGPSESTQPGLTHGHLRLPATRAGPSAL
jgi:hypothetical protein